MVNEPSVFEPLKFYCRCISDSKYNNCRFCYNYPPPKAKGFTFVHVRPFVFPNVRPSGAITERNFMKLILIMYHNNDVIYIKIVQD